MKEKRKHKVMIGIEVVLLCMILATLSTNAASSNPPSNGVSYSKNSQTTVEGALNDLYNKANYGNATASQILKGRTALVGGKQVTGTYEAPTCPTLNSQTPGDAKPENIDEGKIAWVNGKKIVGTGKRTPLSLILRLSDYVSYVPSSTSYTISKEETGHSSDQTINPSGLDLWRVIRKNGDGTVDVVSENISSFWVYFKKEAGYNNYIGALNKVASAYETDGITVGSRHMGYDSAKAEEYVDTINAPDEGYRTDFDLVRAIGALKATPKDLYDHESEYWLASRSEGKMWNYSVRVYDGQRELIYDKDIYSPSSGEDRNKRVRPIVVLKSTLKITGGEGTKDNPWTIAS